MWLRGGAIHVCKIDRSTCFLPFSARFCRCICRDSGCVCWSDSTPGGRVDHNSGVHSTASKFRSFSAWSEDIEHCAQHHLAPGQENRDAPQPLSTYLLCKTTISFCFPCNEVDVRAHDWQRRPFILSCELREFVAPANSSWALRNSEVPWAAGLFLAVDSLQHPKGLEAIWSSASSQGQQVNKLLGPKPPQVHTHTHIYIAGSRTGGVLLHL